MHPLDQELNLHMMIQISRLACERGRPSYQILGNCGTVMGLPESS